MYYWPKRYYSRTLIIIILIKTTICFCDTVKQESESILTSYINNKKYKPILHFLNNIHWSLPSSNILEKKKVLISSIDSSALSSAIQWIQYYVKYKKEIYDSIVVLEEMENGDEWIIGNAKIHDYIGDDYSISFVDARSLTVVLTYHNNWLSIMDTNKFKSDFLEKIKRDIDIENIAPLKWLSVNIENFDNYIIGKITCKEDYYYCNLPNKETVRFFTDGKVTVFDFPKVRNPVRDKFGYNENLTIGRISRNDQRKYIRFGKKDRIDFYKEMINEFPWVKDSIIRIKEENRNVQILKKLE